MRKDLTYSQKIWIRADKPLHVIYPTKYHQKLRWVCQAHWRGFTKKYPSLKAALDAGETASVHDDFRYEHPSKKYLLGVTLFNPTHLKDFKENKFLRKERMEGDLKNVEIPLSWLKVQQWFPPGTVGATSRSWGYMEIIDHGYLYLGAQKDVMVEFFLHGEKVSGRFIGRSLPLRQGQSWLFWFPDDQTPYVKTKDGKIWFEKTLKGKVPIKWLCGQQLNLQQIISRAVINRCKNLS